MGKYRRRRVVWVPRGYRLKSRYRKTNKTLQAETQIQEESVSQVTETESTAQVSQANQGSPSSNEPPMQVTEETAINTKTESKLAEFDASFNPYQSYVQDLARCLTSMPKSVFATNVQDEAEHPKESNPDAKQANNPKKPSEPVHPSSGQAPSQCAPQTQPEASPVPSTDRSSTQVNWSQASCYQTGSTYPYQFHFKAHLSSVKESQAARKTQQEHQNQPIENKDKVIKETVHSEGKNQSRQPHLRRLTGVRSCMRATDHQ